MILRAELNAEFKYRRISLDARSRQSFILIPPCKLNSQYNKPCGFNSHNRPYVTSVRSLTSLLIEQANTDLSRSLQQTDKRSNALFVLHELEAEIAIVPRDRRGARGLDRAIGAITGKSQEDREVPIRGHPYSGLPQQFGPIVITLNHPPPVTPSCCRKAGPISTLPVDRKCTRVAA